MVRVIEAPQDETVVTPQRPAPPGGEAQGQVLPGRVAAPPRIGKYEVVRLLGQGGMGAVYQAFDPVLERNVALKVMLPETAGDPEQKQRFEREARAVARLSHPGIVTVFDLGYHTDGSPYIVMELLKGQDLFGRLREGPQLSLAEKVTIVAQVLEGLNHAHKSGIVHRDVKPANVFLAEDGAARIMDFGIAFCTASGGTSKTVLGTVGYMSPEQVQGLRVDGRSDIFSVGTLLHELLSGKRPFDAETPMATFYKIARGQAQIALPPGPEYQVFLPLIHRALKVAVEERYASAADFAAELRACLDAPAAPAKTAPATASGSAPAVATSVLDAAVDAAAAGAAQAAAEAAPTAPTAASAAAAAATTAPPPRVDPSRLLALLREAYVGRKSGHLHLAVDGERKSLRIRQGEIVHGTSDTAGEHMGDVLVRYGIISDADRQRAVATVLGERRRLGGVLEELGLLDRERVREAIGLHAREILFGAIARPGVSCAFEELADCLIEDELDSPFSTGQLILEATRRILDPELVRTVLGDLGRVLVLSPNPMLRTQRITLTPADGFVLSRIDGATSARDVMALVPLPGDDAERSLFSLLCTGVIDYVRAAEPTSRRRPPAGPHTAPAPQPAAPPARSAGGVAASARPAAAEAPPRAAVPSSGPPPAPPTQPPAVPATPAKPAVPAEPALDDRPARAARDSSSVRLLILETHERLKRDHFEVLGLERSASETEVREAYGRYARLLHPDACRDTGLEDLREKREAVFIRVTEAYEVLRDAESRAAYERAFEPSRFRQAPARVSPPRAEQARPAPEPPPPAPKPAAPAPVPAGSEPAPSEIDPRLLPENLLRVAQKLFAEERYWEAIQQLEPLVERAEGDTRVQAKVLLARGYLRNPMWKKRAEAMLQSVLDDSPRNVGAYLLLGQLYREAQLTARARSCYRKVLDLDPQHHGAIEALAVLETPTEKSEAKAGGLSGIAGLFRRR